MKRRSFLRTMSSISDVSAGTGGGDDSDNLEPSETFYSASAPASVEFTFSSSPNHLANIGGDSKIRRLSLERFVAEINDPTDVRVSPLRAPTRTISTKVLDKLGKSARNLLAPPAKVKKNVARKHSGGSKKEAPMMPMRKASFID